MDNKFQCEHRHHVVGKGNKRCTHYAVHEVYVQTPTGKHFIKLCEKHYQRLLTDNAVILQHNILNQNDICPECGAPLEFFNGTAICSGNHPISARLQQYLIDRYPKTQETQGEMICQ